jgi:hypothetical protein
MYILSIIAFVGCETGGSCSILTSSNTYLYFGLNSLQPAYLIVGDRNTGFNPQLSGRDFSVYVVIEEVRILHDPPVSHLMVFNATFNNISVISWW